jgi:hypothetical protein
VAIIAHGSSNARAIRNAVRTAADEALVRHVNSEIVDAVTATPPSLAAKPVSRGIRGVLGRMRERLHSGRDMHAGKRFETYPDPATPEGAHGKRESVPSSGATHRTGPITADVPHSDAANSRKLSIEKTALSNGGPSAAESSKSEVDEPPDDGGRPVKPV